MPSSFTSLPLLCVTVLLILLDMSQICFRAGKYLGCWFNVQKQRWCTVLVFSFLVCSECNRNQLDFQLSIIKDLSSILPFSIIFFFQCFFSEIVKHWSIAASLPWSCFSFRWEGCSASPHCYVHNRHEHELLCVTREPGLQHLKHSEVGCEQCLQERQPAGLPAFI